MGATGRNIVKFITGSAAGAAVGALLAQVAESVAKSDDSLEGAQPVTGQPEASAASIKDTGLGKITELRDTLRARWERAKQEGEKAKAAREAELRAYFREKVNDPTAFPPGAPTRTDG